MKDRRRIAAALGRVRGKESKIKEAPTAQTREVIYIYPRTFGVYCIGMPTSALIRFLAEDKRTKIR